MHIFDQVTEKYSAHLGVFFIDNGGYAFVFLHKFFT